MMFIRVPIEDIIPTGGELETKIQQSEKKFLNCLDSILQEVIAELVNGILILTEEREIVFANECACRILRQINQNMGADPIPKEIWYICKSLIEIRALFPEQQWLINTKVCLNSSVSFDVQARHLKLKKPDKYCVVLVLKDQYQLVKNIALEESREYGLTDREREIWLLQRANYTYKQIASELFIAPNTVKKHLQNIHLKKNFYLKGKSHQVR